MHKTNTQRQERRAKGLCALCGEVKSDTYACDACQRKNRARRRKSGAKMPASEMKFVDLDKIRIDGGTQLRAEINTEHVADLARSIERGDKMPPVKIFNDGADLWLARGFHRYHAHRKAGRAKIEAEVVEGTKRDAVLDAAGDNAEHLALRRSNADKRKAIETLLSDPEWSENSSRWIAEQCHVSHTAVEAIRTKMAKLPTGNGDTTPKTRKVRTRDGKVRTVKPKARAEKNGQHVEQPAEQPEADKQPFDNFNAGLDELLDQARSLRMRTATFLRFSKATGRSDVKWAAKMAESETVGNLNHFIRHLEDDRPAEVDGTAPKGFWTAGEMSPREKAFRAAKAGGAK